MKKGSQVGEYHPRVFSPKRAPQAIDIAQGNNGENKNFASSSTLRWVHVNEVTWMLTDGVKIRVPGGGLIRHGHDDNRALAWVMNIGWPAGRGPWLARCGDRYQGYVTLAKAKRMAEKLVAESDETLLVRLGEQITPAEAIRELNANAALVVDR